MKLNKKKQKQMYYLTDAPKPWGLFFQDSASPQMEALMELHNVIFYYLMLILFMVSYILLSIIINFFHKNWLISNKYLNHGKLVPSQKCFKLKNLTKFIQLKDLILL